MFDWFCSCKPQEEDRSVVQEYPPLNSGELSKRNPKGEQDIEIGRATQAQTSLNIKKEMELLKPRSEQQANPNKDGYLSINTLKGDVSSNSIFRKIKKSRYEQILKECAKKNQKWTDPDFNYEVKSPIKDWLRVTEIIPDATFMAHPVRPTAAQQGLFFNNGYFISAVAALARREYRIKSMFASLEMNKWGVYMCRLLFDGVYQEVVVDDRFPVDKFGHPLTARFHITDIWVMVLEKCWAKLNTSYESTNKTQSIQLPNTQREQMDECNASALRALTSSPVLGPYAVTYIPKDSGQVQAFFDKLMQHHKLNHPIVCSINPRRGKLAQQVKMQTPYYSILGIFEIQYKGNKIRLLQLRNPMGKFGTNVEFPDLPYNYRDQFWKTISNEEKDELQYWRMQNSLGQGIFYVDWRDFFTYFSQITIAQMNDNVNYLYETLNFEPFKPEFFSLFITSSDSMHIFVSQKASVDSLRYAIVRVLVASVRSDANNQPMYEYISSKSLVNFERSNYLSLDLGELLPGNYIISVSLIIGNDSHVKTLPATIGYYGSGVFAIKRENAIDDKEFLCKTLLNRARRPEFTSSLRKPLEKASGWSCIEKIQDSNFCYIAYRIEASSDYENYRIYVDSKKNDQFYFEAYWQGKNLVDEIVGRGKEILIPFTYSGYMANTDRFPSTDQRLQPFAIFDPVIQ